MIATDQYLSKSSAGLRRRIFTFLSWITIVGALIIYLFVTCLFSGPVERDNSKKLYSVNFIHWNDFHSANTPYVAHWGRHKGSLVGGYANLAGYIDSLLKIYPEAVVLNAGDDFQGTPISSFTKGMSQILILNRIVPAAFTIGNHEFDYGWDNFTNCMQHARFPIISCNLYDSTKGGLAVKPYIVVVSNKIRVGVIGLIIESLSSTVMPLNMKGLVALDPVVAIRRQLDLLKDKTDLIVVLSHSGFVEDSLLALQLSDVDLIFGGHSHTVLFQPVKVNNILIFQAGSRGQFLGHLQATVDTEKKTVRDYQYELIENVVGQVIPNPEVSRVVDSLEATIGSEMDKVVAELISPWIRNSDGESNLGNWICDVIRDYFQTDIAFHNSGGIRKGMDAGPVRVRDIWEISPFDNTIVILQVTGDQLLSLLDWRIKHPRDLLQISGIRLIYDTNEKVLVSTTIAGQQIDPKRIYSIATNNYITANIGRFFGLDPDAVKIKDSGLICRDVLVKAAEQQKRIDSKVDGRLVLQ
jgi:5'-nucleotidase/UDP-sugar diphosphatase